jgi:hypothetical protein
MTWRVAAMTLLLLGSGAAAARVAPSELAALHVIGVVSRLGEEAEIKKVGFTAFSNKSTALRIADWRMDALVTSEAASALSSQFILKISPNDSSMIKDVKRELLHRLGPWDRRFVAMPESGLDAYLVFLPASLDFPYPSNQSVEGLGMLHDPHASSDKPGDQPEQFDGTAFAPSRPTAAIVYAVYDIYLVEAKSGRIIAVQEAEIPTRYHQTLAQRLWNGTPYAPIHYPHPHDYVASGIWSDTADALTDAQKQAMRDSLTSLIKTSVAYSLGLMGLTAGQTGAPPASATPPPG